MALDAHPTGGLAGRVGQRMAALLVIAACLAVEPATAHAAASDTDAEAPTLSLPDPAPGTAVADAAETADAAPNSLGWRWQSSLRAGLNGASFDPSRGPAGAAPSIDYRLWVGNQRTEFGIGIGSTASAPRVLAFRHQFSPQTRLIVDTELGGSAGAPTPHASRPLSVGLESAPLHGLAKGILLRAQLDLRSSVALRLRGGRLGVYLQMQLSGQD
jgi:hypothetical protein